MKGIGLRVLLFLAGLFFAVPENDYIGLNHWQLAAIGLALAAAPLFTAWTWHREKSGEVPAGAERQRPLKLASRLSRKAPTASAWSSVLWQMP